MNYSSRSQRLVSVSQRQSRICRQKEIRKQNFIKAFFKNIRFSIKVALAVPVVGIFLFAYSIPAYSLSPQILSRINPIISDKNDIIALEASLYFDSAGELSAQYIADISYVDVITDQFIVSAEKKSVVTPNGVAAGVVYCSSVNASSVGDYVIPVPEGTYYISSGIGYRWGRQHQGIDYAAPYGTPVVAAMAGEVVGVGYSGSNPYVQIRSFLSDGTQLDHYYLHMPYSSIKVKVGDIVKAGTYIANVGSEGNSTGAHLHFEVRVNGGSGVGVYQGVVIDGNEWLLQKGATHVSSRC